MFLHTAAQVFYLCWDENLFKRCFFLFFFKFCYRYCLLHKVRIKVMREQAYILFTIHEY